MIAWGMHAAAAFLVNRSAILVGCASVHEQTSSCSLHKIG